MKLVSLIEKIGFSQHLSKDVEDVTADKFEDFGEIIGFDDQEEEENEEDEDNINDETKEKANAPIPFKPQVLYGGTRKSDS